MALNLGLVRVIGGQDGGTVKHEARALSLAGWLALLCVCGCAAPASTSRCGEWTTPASRDACREWLDQERACGANGVASAKVTVTSPTTDDKGSVERTTGVRGGSASGGASHSGGDYTVEVVCNRPPT